MKTPMASSINEFRLNERRSMDYKSCLMLWSRVAEIAYDDLRSTSTQEARKALSYIESKTGTFPDICRMFNVDRDKCIKAARDIYNRAQIGRNYARKHRDMYRGQA